MSFKVVCKLSVDGYSKADGGIRIGNQIWMDSNLNVGRFQNGDLIPEAKTRKEYKKASEIRHPAWCYYENDSIKGEKYGRLYNWFVVEDYRNVCPKGWHVPSESEWLELINYLNNNGYKNIEGKSLKSKSGWRNKGNGSDVFYFSGLPGGGRDPYGKFLGLLQDGFWWTSTSKNKDFSLLFKLDFQNDPIVSGQSKKESSFSIRCVKD